MSNEVVKVDQTDHAQNSIISEPQYFYAAQAKTLDARLNDIVLSDEEIESLKNKQGVKVVKDAILGSFAIGKAVKVFLDWNDNVDKAVKDAKKNALIGNYMAMSEENSKAITALQTLVTDPVGSVLFNKILSILDNNPPDEEQFAHLASALKRITDSDFQALFAEHKYAVAQIEQMTPQALSILANHKSWPEIKLPGYSSNGTKVTSDYNDDFAMHFAQSKGINDSGTIERLKHSISELISRRFIEAHLVGEMRAVCKTTKVGSFIIPYLSDTFKR